LSYRPGFHFCLDAKTKQKDQGKNKLPPGRGITYFCLDTKVPKNQGSQYF